MRAGQSGTMKLTTSGLTFANSGDARLKRNNPVCTYFKGKGSRKNEKEISIFGCSKYGQVGCHWKILQNVVQTCISLNNDLITDNKQYTYLLSPTTRKFSKLICKRSFFSFCCEKVVRISLLTVQKRGCSNNFSRNLWLMYCCLAVQVQQWKILFSTQHYWHRLEI